MNEAEEFLTAIHKRKNTRRYCVPQAALPILAALVILREKVLKPILAGVGKPRVGRKPKNWSTLDQHYESIRRDLFTLFRDLGIAA